MYVQITADFQNNTASMTYGCGCSHTDDNCCKARGDSVPQLQQWDTDYILNFVRDYLGYFGVYNIQGVVQLQINMFDDHVPQELLDELFCVE